MDKVIRGTKRTFTILITDRDGNPQDPDSCTLSFVKEGEYSYDSPRGPWVCSSTGTVGYWCAEVAIPEHITLGTWLAVYTWLSDSESNAELFPFIIEDKIRPWINKRPLPPNVKVVG